MSQYDKQKSHETEDEDLIRWGLDPQSLNATNTPYSCSTTSISPDHLVTNPIQDNPKPYKPLKKVTTAFNSNNNRRKDNYSSNISNNIRSQPIPPGLGALKQFRNTIDFKEDKKYSDQFLTNLTSLYGNKSDEFMTTNLNTLSKYNLLEQIGCGSYGKVYKAKSIQTKQIVAVKKLETFTNKSPKYTKDEDAIKHQNELHLVVREIMCLKNCCHSNINKLLDVVIDIKSNNLCFVLEYVPNELYTLMEALKLLHIKSVKSRNKTDYFNPKTLKTVRILTPPNWFEVSHIKSIIWDILCALKHLKEQCIIHRDLKPQNLLITNNGQVKLCDFGLSRRKYKNNELLTNERRVVTRWYRAPEILIEQDKKRSNYSFESDMWSLGAIFAELLMGKAIFDAENDLNQIGKIISICGSINNNDITIVNMKEFLKKLKPNHKNIKRNLSLTLQNCIPFWTKENVKFGLELINQMLCYNPFKRITPEKAIKHSWFELSPRKKSLKSLIKLYHNQKHNLIINKNKNNNNRKKTRNRKQMMNNNYTYNYDMQNNQRVYRTGNNYKLNQSTGHTMQNKRRFDETNNCTNNIQKTKYKKRKI